MLEYRRITVDDKENLKELHNTVYNSLERKEFFMPFSDEVVDMMFDNEKIIAYGAYHHGKLIGTAQLYLSEIFVEEVKELLGLQNNKVADLGGSLVLSEYRKNGIMTSLATILIQEAKKRGIDYIIVTAHPENKASINTFLNLGLKEVMTTNFGEYSRNVYMLDLIKKRRKVNVLQ